MITASNAPKTTKKISANGNVYYYQYSKKGNIRKRLERVLHLYGAYLPKGANDIVVDEILKIINKKSCNY